MTIVQTLGQSCNMSHYSHRPICNLRRSAIVCHKKFKLKCIFQFFYNMFTCHIRDISRTRGQRGGRRRGIRVAMLPCYPGTLAFAPSYYISFTSFKSSLFYNLKALFVLPLNSHTSDLFTYS